MERDEIQAVAEEMEDKLYSIEEAIKAINDLEKICNILDMKEGCYELLKPARDKLAEIKGGMEATIEELKEF